MVRFLEMDPYGIGGGSWRVFIASQAQAGGPQQQHPRTVKHLSLPALHSTPTIVAGGDRVPRMNAAMVMVMGMGMELSLDPRSRLDLPWSMPPDTADTARKLLYVVVASERDAAAQMNAY